MRRMKFWAAAGAVLFGLVACGGGGGSAGNSVFGGDNPPAAVAADLTVVLDKQSLPNGGTDAVVATITAVDANRNALSGIPITVSVDAGAVAQVSGASTSAEGKVTANVTPGEDRTNRTVTVTARSGSLVRTASFQVIGAKLTAIVTPSIAAPGQAVAVEFKLVDSAGNPMKAQAINVTSSVVASSSGTTANAGEYKVNFSAPTGAGDVVLTASAAGTSVDALLTVNGGSVVVPTVPQGSVLSASVSANPSVVVANTAPGTSNRTEIRALFNGVNNARVKNVRVRFDLDGDVNTIGGTLSSDKNIVYSDANGIASTNYSPGVVSSPTNGVTVRACWDYADFAEGSCPHSAKTTLTVVSEALHISIGTDEIVQLATGTYIKDFVVLVVDAAGRAKPDVEITPSLDLVAFYKGVYNVVGTQWVQFDRTQDGPYSWNGSSWVNHFGESNTVPQCPNEDPNRNGVLENGEDLNGNATLDPSGVTIKNLGSTKTDSSGKAVVRIEYPRNFGSWIDYKITVTGTVSGTEGRAVYLGARYGLGALPVPASAINDTQSSPAFVISPFGRSAGCNNTN